MTKTKVLFFALLTAGLLSVPVEGHHSFTQFDRETELVQTGTIVRWAFNNPHSWLYVNVPNEDGTETLWSFEASAPVGLLRRGISGNTFVPGESLTFMFCPMVDGRPGGHLGWALLADGSYINPSDGGCNGSDENISQWREWMDQGYRSNRDALASQ